LYQALMDYFGVNRWRKTKGLTRKPPFNIWADEDVRQAVYALETVGVLERRPGSNTQRAQYRVPLAGAHWWARALAGMLEGQPEPPPEPILTFVDAYTLFVIGRYQLLHGKPPSQTQLYQPGDDDNPCGLLNEWLASSGAIERTVHFCGGAPHLDASARRLAAHGFMVPRGDRRRKSGYWLTEAGLAYVRDHLVGKHWSAWLVIDAE
jgi:hypothetical protein